MVINEHLSVSSDLYPQCKSEGERERGGGGVVVKRDREKYCVKCRRK